MKSGYVIRISALLLVALLVTAEMTSAAPYSDYDNLRDLYELLLRRETEGATVPMAAYNHQMERKGGRSPSLRLRFGRRADPLWHSDGPAEPPSN